MREDSNQRQSDEESKSERLRRRAATLVAETNRGVLATRDDDGYPYTSFVELIADDQNRLWCLLSDLAPHTTYIDRDERASLLLRAEPEADEQPLEATRGSYRGRIAEVEEAPEAIESKYLEVHPHAEQYIDFADFSFYRFEIERVRMVGGFGDVGWVESLEG